MSIPSIVKQIRALPFHDMMVIAEELKARLGELTSNKIEAVALAQILSNLSSAQLVASVQTDQEEKVLREIFSRKRTINIDRYGPKGWDVSIPTVNGSDVIGTDLRSCFPMMLDQIITLHVLSK